MSVTVLVVGPAGHGVTREASAQEAALRAAAPDRVHLLRRTGIPDVAELRTALRAAPPGPVLVHVTDRLFGATPEDAADAVKRKI